MESARVDAVVLVVVVVLAGCGVTGPGSAQGPQPTDRGVSAEALAWQVAPGPALATSSGRCVGAVDELPQSELFDPRDQRLRGASLLVVDKSDRRLMLFAGGLLADCWRVGLGFEPAGHKQVEGDGRTPIGWYRTSDKPWSMFDGAIAIHYPSVVDARAAVRRGTIGARTRSRIVAAHHKWRVPPQQTALGGNVLIHGGGSASDWTLGCIALEDKDLEALRARMPRRQRTNLLILP